MFAGSAMHAGRRSFAPLPPLSSHPSPDDHELFKDFAAVSPRKRSNPRFRRPPPPRFESSAPPSHGEGEATTGVRPVPQGSATRVLHLNAGHLKLSGCVLSLSLSLSRNVFYHFTPRETWRTWRIRFFLCTCTLFVYICFD